MRFKRVRSLPSKRVPYPLETAALKAASEDATEPFTYKRYVELEMQKPRKSLIYGAFTYMAER